MAYTGGILLFALGILISVALHEAGHMFSARAFGMKVTRFFIGFGPTLFSFRRKETEYGLKAIPAGAFVSIVGMTPLDEVAPEDESRVFWKRPVWKRTIVLAAGSLTHFVLGVVLLYITAVFVGLPNPERASYDASKEPAVLGTVNECVPANPDSVNCSLANGDPKSPAAAAGLEPGDRIITFAGQNTPTYGELVTQVRKSPAGPTEVTYVRDGVTTTATITVVRRNLDISTTDTPKVQEVGFLGVAPKGSDAPLTVTYGPVDGVGQAFDYTGQIFAGTFRAIANFPEKIPKLWDALMGQERDPETPVSVVGASRIGGEVVERGIWPIFFLLLANLNFFIGVFNLFPLLPLDGGHIAIAWFEKVRSWWAAKRGKPDPGRVDYTKLLPITYAVVLIFGGITLLTVATDIINPITLTR
ncbi:M50 family metallopeptidase [Cryptosporangium aurantiacum]|uniref:RIP metalloprotease RseP n=1 Tax=Cryptosporangium aurantiacum TaxID=134849 RepID=A0A1M7I1V6_9ACTN|nr:site-2 protease family protein [Cryptosporangium aurantiacum]SHM34695.1 RIP metalloprotease RseP [Cryptosporangium aurantiacum]